jgi:hypothetical protein
MSLGIGCGISTRRANLFCLLSVHPRHAHRQQSTDVWALRELEQSLHFRNVERHLTGYSRDVGHVAGSVGSKAAKNLCTGTPRFDAKPR